MLEAARWTMSSRNEQPWRYVVARKENPTAFEELLGCLKEGNQEWAHLAPVLMMSFYKRTYSTKNECSKEELNPVAEHDLGAASAALTFQATAMGLYVHQMAGIRPEVARTTYEVPEDFEPLAGIAVSYLGDPEQLPEHRQKSERQPRSRRPLSAFVFEESWGETAGLIE